LNRAPILHFGLFRTQPRNPAQLCSRVKPLAWAPTHRGALPAERRRHPISTPPTSTSWISPRGDAPCPAVDNRLRDRGGRARGDSGDGYLTRGGAVGVRRALITWSRASTSSPHVLEITVEIGRLGRGPLVLGSTSRPREGPHVRPGAARGRINDTSSTTYAADCVIIATPHRLHRVLCSRARGPIVSPQPSLRAAHNRCRRHLLFETGLSSRAREILALHRLPTTARRPHHRHRRARARCTGGGRHGVGAAAATARRHRHLRTPRLPSRS